MLLMTRRALSISPYRRGRHLSLLQRHLQRVRPPPDQRGAAVCVLELRRQLTRLGRRAFACVSGGALGRVQCRGRGVAAQVEIRLNIDSSLSYFSLKR